MKKATFAAALLIASAVMAQADVGAAGARIRDIRMSANLKLYVVDGGTDVANNCQTQLNPCATPQHAIDTLPKLYGYNALVSVGAGTFPGFSIEGFTFAYSANNPGGPTPDGGTSPWIWVQGTMANVTDAGGGQLSGTVASATSGGSAQGGAPNTWGTVTVPTPGWATNGLVGYQFCITGGPDQGECRQVDSNDSGVATIVGSWTTTPTSSSTWQIEDVATFYTPTLKQEQPPFTGTLSDIYAPDTTAINVKGNNGQGVMTWPIIISNFGVNATATATRVIRESGSTNSVAILNSRLVNTGSNTARFAVLDNGAHLLLQSNYMDCHSATGACRIMYSGLEDQYFALAAGDTYVLENFNKWRGNDETTCVNGSLYGHGGYAGRYSGTQNSYTGITRGYNVGGPVWIAVQGDHMLASPAVNCTIAYISTAASNYTLFGTVQIDGITFDGNSGASERFLDLYNQMTVVFYYDQSTVLNTQVPYFFRGRDSYIGITEESDLSTVPIPTGSTNDITFELKTANQVINSVNTVPTTGVNRCILETSNNNKICNQ